MAWPAVHACGALTVRLRVFHREDGQVTWSWQIAKTWKACQPPKSTSKSASTKQPPRKKLHDSHAWTANVVFLERRRHSPHTSARQMLHLNRLSMCQPGKW